MLEVRQPTARELDGCLLILAMAGPGRVDDGSRGENDNREPRDVDSSASHDMWIGARIVPVGSLLGIANLANLAKLKCGEFPGKNAKTSNLVNLARTFSSGVILPANLHVGVISVDLRRWQQSNGTMPVFVVGK